MTESSNSLGARLALGTVQFGLDYGVSNPTGQVPIGEAMAILRLASTAGIELLDTARRYGTSEAVLGELLSAGPLCFQIVSKLPPQCSAERVADELNSSLQLLSVKSLYAYLAHSFADYQQAPLRQQLYQARAKGLVQKVGASLYFPSELAWLLDNDIDIDLVQLPYSIFDQRFASLLGPAHESGIEIHARSLFLQGLFFLSPAAVAQQFPEALEHHASFHRLCADHHLAVSSALINFGLTEPHLDKLVIGLTTTGELAHNLAAIQDHERYKPLHNVFSALQLHEERVILPFNWA